jgi:hypothetical protein
VGFLGTITLHVAANAAGPCCSKFALKQRTQHEKNNSEATHREHTRQEAKQAENCRGLHYGWAKRVALIELSVRARALP